jgi:hypothetical protein
MLARGVFGFEVVPLPPGGLFRLLSRLPDTVGDGFALIDGRFESRRNGIKMTATHLGQSTW